MITSILPNIRKPGRFVIEADGRELATLSIEAIERLRLGTGSVLDERLQLEIARESGVLETYDRALNMLAVRARSAAELRRLLVRKGEPVDRVDAAIERLRAIGFIDDASFARQFTRSKALGAGLSRRRLQQELSKRGVMREISDAAIEQVFVEEGVDEEVSIERVARKKLHMLEQVDAPTRRRRLYSFLARRGYDADDISRVLRVVLRDGDEDAADSRFDD